MLQNYPHFTGNIVLGLDIPGGRRDVSTSMVLKDLGQAERRRGEKRDGRRDRSRGQSVKGASSCVPRRRRVSHEEPQSPVCSSHFTDGHTEHLRTLTLGSRW